MLHCAISTTVNDKPDLINLLELIVIMMFGISIYTKSLYRLVGLVNDLTYIVYTCQDFLGGSYIFTGSHATQ